MEGKYNLVLQTAFLGDLILTWPLLTNLRTLHPDHKLALVVKKGYGSLASSFGFADIVLEIDKAQIASYTQVLGELQKLKISNVYATSFASHRMLRFLWQIPAERKVGYNWSLFSRFVLDDKINRNKNWPEVLRLCALIAPESPAIEDSLAKYDSSLVPPLLKIPKIFSFSDQWKRAAEKFPSGTPKRVAIFPGSVWNTKKWTIEGFIAVARELSKLGYQVSLFGGSDERELGFRIVSEVPTVENLIGAFSLGQSMKELANYDLVISNDSGGQHMASFLGIPVVTIFGPTTKAFGYFAWNEKSVIIENQELSCRPCGSHGHQKCPIGTHDCMVSIQPQAVIRAALGFLNP